MPLKIYFKNKTLSKMAKTKIPKMLRVLEILIKMWQQAED